MSNYREVLAVPGLILITDSSRMKRERLFATVDAALCGGADAVLVREKLMDSARLLAFCSRLRAVTAAHHALLIVHGQADIAKAVGADGIHVAAGSIHEIPAMRQWLAHADMTISASCHDAGELGLAGRCGADFTLLSPVFTTASHPGTPHLGVKRFHALSNTASLPVVALGGITPKNRSELTGYPVAVISAILDADDPEQIARYL